MYAEPSSLALDETHPSDRAGHGDSDGASDSASDSASHTDLDTYGDTGPDRTLPEPVQRWLRRCVAPGTQSFSQVELRLEGYLKLGSWHPFSAEQTIRPRHGYRWSVRTRVAGLPVRYDEWMNPSQAERSWQAMRCSLGRSEGVELLSSTAGRLAAESAFVPTTARLASWDPAVDDSSAFASWRIGGRVDRVRVEVAPSGRLRSASLRRWGTPPGAAYGRHPYGLEFDGELSVQGVTIPRLVSASWWWGSDRQDDGLVLRAEVVAAHFS